MSSTRRAKDDSVYHQSRYASSPEYERGLSAKMVAKKVSVLDKKQDRQLIWFLHYVSHFDGGLADLAEQLVQKYPDQVGTPAMIEIGKSGSKTFTADEVRRIRREMPGVMRYNFPLKGEGEHFECDWGNPSAAEFKWQAAQLKRGAEAAEYLEALRDGKEHAPRQPGLEELERAARHPGSYPVSAFLDFCRSAAMKVGSDKMTSLERALFDLCLDPAVTLDAGSGPWYFAGMVDVLRKFYHDWTAAKAESTVVTSLGKKMYSTLEYTQHTRRMSLSVGVPRTGKSTSMKAWCKQRPGCARFVEVPPGNDDGGFYRALARGIGLGNFSQYNSVDLRERVESVLLAGDLVLCLDDAQKLWPQRNFREGFPMRIEWVMSMVNAGVPIALVSTPEFFTRLAIAEKNAGRSGWDPAQFVGRVGLYNPLPTKLADDDLVAVARAMLPEASQNALKALAIYAKKSARYLAAIESIAGVACYRAQQNGRQSPSSQDIRAAMEESVIPSDSSLLKTLEKMKTGRKSTTLPVYDMDAPEDRQQLPDAASGREPDIPAPASGRETVPTSNEIK